LQSSVVTNGPDASFNVFSEFLNRNGKKNSAATNNVMEIMIARFL